MAAAFVQAEEGPDVDGGGTLIQRAFLSNVTAGNLIVVGFTWSASADEELTDVDDNLGNTYVQIGTSLREPTNEQMLSVYYAKNIGGGACTVTATCPGTRFFRRAILAEYSGLDTASPLDKSDDTENGSIVTGTDGLVTPSVSPANDGQAVVGVLMTNGGTATISAGTGFTERDDTGATDPGLQLEDQIQTTATAVTGKWTATAAGGFYNAIIATFQVPQVGGGRLYGPALLTNAAATKYTAPATGALINEIHVSNPTGSPVDFTLSIGADAAATRLFDGLSIPADSMQEFAEYIPLGNGEIIQAFAGTNNVITLTIDGFELP